MRTVIRRGTGSCERSSPLPSQGSSMRSESWRVMAWTSATPGVAPAASAAFRTWASMSTPAWGLIWIVTSCETLERQP